MLISFIEVYKKEAYGIILGNKKGKTCNIKKATVFQTAERNYDFVSMDVLKEGKINNTLKYLCNYKLIGDFHSHTNSTDVLSRHDIKELKNMGEGWISLLVSIKKSKRKNKWKYNKNQKCLVGSISKKYTVKILAYMYDDKKNKPIKVQMRCRYIKNLNKRQRMYEELEKKIEKIEKEVKKKTTIKKKLTKKRIKI